MASPDLGIYAVKGALFQVPHMTEAELRHVTKESFSLKLRAKNPDLPSRAFAIENLHPVFRVMLDRVHLLYNPRTDFAEVRKEALAQWSHSPWDRSITRELEFQFPHDDPSIWVKSKIPCKIKGVTYCLPPLVKSLFTESAPDLTIFLQDFRECNPVAIRSVDGKVARKAFRLYIQSYFPHADSATAGRLSGQFNSNAEVCKILRTWPRRPSKNERRRHLKEQIPLKENLPLQDSSNLEPDHHTHPDQPCSGEGDVLSALDAYLEHKLLKSNLSQPREPDPVEME